MNQRHSLQKSHNKDKKPTTAIYSAALQDHFLKKFTTNLNLDFNKKSHEEKRVTMKKLPSLPSQMD